MTKKRNSSIISIFSVLIILFAVVSLSGCFSDWEGGPANVIISFGGGREALDGGVNYSSTDTETHKSLLYKIEFTGAVKNYEYSFTGTTFNATVLPGDYNILVVSYQGDIVYGAGSKNITVKQGQNKVSLTMYRAYMVIFYDNETDTQIKQVVRKENGYKVIRPDGQEWYDDKTLIGDPFNFNVAIEGNLKLYSSVPVFNDETIINFGEWLASKKPNSPSTAYKVKMNVESLKIPDSLVIGQILIQGTNVNKYVSFDFSGSTLTKIDDFAFEDCSNLTNIIIGKNIEEIGMTAFYGCTSLESITIPVTIKNIGVYAFSNCTNLTSVKLECNVGSIGQGTFNACNKLTSITIPDSVKNIQQDAFSNCTNLKTVEIRNGVEEIGSNAFGNCTSLESITIPGSVQYIRSNAFSNCTNITSVTIEYGVTSIGQTAFQDCSSLTSVTIPASVTTIGDNAFERCTKLVEVTFKGNIAYFGSAFPENANGGCGTKLWYAYSEYVAGTYIYNPASGNWTKQQQ